MRDHSSDIKTEPNANGGPPVKNPWGSLSKNWGVADFVEDDYLPKAPLPVLPPKEPFAGSVKERLGFRPQEEEDFDDEEEEEPVLSLSDESESGSSSEAESWCKRSKMPRMRMHADDEEEKLRKRKGKIRHMVSRVYHFCREHIKKK